MTQQAYRISLSDEESGHVLTAPSVAIFSSRKLRKFVFILKTNKQKKSRIIPHIYLHVG